LYPRLLQFGHFTLYTYGVLAAIGLIAGLTLIVRLAKRDGIDEEKTWNLGLVCIVAGVLGAVVIPLLVAAARRDSDGGESSAQRLLTVIVVGLAAATIAVVLRDLITKADSLPASTDAPKGGRVVAHFPDVHEGWHEARATFVATAAGMAFLGLCYLLVLRRSARLLDLAIARAPRPRLLRLDEPTAGMSPTETADTVRLIQERCAREYGLTLSLGGIIGVVKRVAAVGADAYAQLQADIRGSPVVHMDETGWRECGKRGYIWTASTPRTCYFHFDARRAGDVADGIITTDFAGVLVTDFYSAYGHFECPKQRCWAHLWRDIDDLADAYPQDTELAAWITGVRSIYDAARGPRPAQEGGTTVDAERAREQRARLSEQQLLLLCPEDMPKTRPEVTLAKRIRKHSGELFTFVADPRVPATNNAAERSLRSLVVMRKISGGTRSSAGSTAKMTLASLVATARLRGENPTAVFYDLLTAAIAHLAPSHTL